MSVPTVRDDRLTPEDQEQFHQAAASAASQERAVARARGTTSGTLFPRDAPGWTWPFGFPPPTPPLLFRHQGPDFIDGGNGNGYIDTSCSLFSNGQIAGTTHIWAVNWFGGFTGGVVAIVADAAGAIIAQTDVQQYGVDGTAVPFKQSNRTESWSADVGADAATKAQALYVVNFYAPHDRMGEDLKVIFDAVTSVVRFVEKACTDMPEICAAVQAAFA